MKGRHSAKIKILVVLTYAGMVTVNALANALPINGVTTGEVSNSYPNLFAPASLTFSIWGLIYLLLFGYTLYQLGLFQMDRGESRADLFRTVGLYFSVSSIANMMWIFAWHYDNITLSLLLMLVILACLIVIVQTIHRERLSREEKIFIKIPFSVYFGWITVATIANVTTLLVSVGWEGFGIAQEAWTAIVLLVGVLIGIATMLRNRDIAYGLVIIWAYTGILIKHVSPAQFAGQYPAVIVTVIACLALLVFAVYRTRKMGVPST